MEFNIQQLLEKWQPVLDDENFSKIRGQDRRETVAVLLENQATANMQTLRKDPTQSLTYLLESAPTNSMGSSSSTASAGAVDIYDPVLISMVRRSMPNLIAYDVCGVQPMTMPTGLIFALKSRYGSQTGTEALFNEANTYWSAQGSGGTTAQAGGDPSLLISSGNSAYTAGTGMSTALAEALGDASNNSIREMALSIEKVSVQAVSRKLKAEYTHELAQDMRAVHQLDAEKELANILSAEILADINREVIRQIYSTSTIGAQTGTTTAGYFDLDTDSDGRWMVERFKGLLFQIEMEANEISKNTRSGKGNWIIVPSNVASAFAMAGYLDYNSALSSERLEVDDTGNTFAGTLFGRIKVFVDPYATSTGNYLCTTGYKGNSKFDAGLFYCPYVPLQMFRATGQDTFQPKIGFQTRYGLVAHPFATTAADGKVLNSPSVNKNKYFRSIVIQNLL